MGPADAPPHRRSAGLAGRVVDPEGHGLAEATVRLFLLEAFRFAAPLRSLRTDADGGFQVDGLAPGRYRVEARAPGFTTASSGPIDVGPDEPAQLLQIPLWRGGVVLSGRVVDAAR